MRQFIPILLFLTSTIIGWPNTATSRQSERPHRIGILHVAITSLPVFRPSRMV